MKKILLVISIIISFVSIILLASCEKEPDPVEGSFTTTPIEGFDD